MQAAIPCMVMRGGTSKGLYFLASDLPEAEEKRNRVLLAAMGSPDARQIDGMGGAHPLTSKVAVVSPSQDPDSDVDYLFLQVVVDRAEVSDAQNCGNILAGVGPFAIESGLISANDGITDVRIHMVNTGARAIARVQTPSGQVDYQGDARIDGVPGTAAPVPIDFLDIAGSSCGALLPTGNVVDTINGVTVTCIDNGMPVVLLKAEDFGLSGIESPAELEANEALKSRLEDIRTVAGPMMGLGDISNKTVPKMCLVSAPVAGGAINTRTFIPHRVHEAIGVLGSVSVATACVMPGSIAWQVAGEQPGSGQLTLEVEHPTGFFTVEMEVDSASAVGGVEVKRAALLRTARLLMRGEVLVPRANGGPV
ncbi:MAG: 4-oxalomesaconate tautomerase [Haliea sp.]|uniref:4-oxalomesaconate tautomerase n=1 Tax=Haliea sp. TaxID=1932666 RepID=UPI0032EDF22F